MKLREYFERCDALNPDERKAQGYLTREQLAVKSGVSYNAIKMYARGAVVSRYSVARKIVDALPPGTVSVEELCE
jgi:predicted transcriptional regulator